MFGVNMLQVILPVPYRAKADVSVADLTCLLCVMCMYIKMEMVSHNDMANATVCAIKVSHISQHKCAHYHFYSVDILHVVRVNVFGLSQYLVSVFSFLTERPCRKRSDLSFNVHVSLFLHSFIKEGKIYQTVKFKYS